MIGTPAERNVELKPLPAEFTKLRPYFADLQYYIADRRIILVFPETRLIVMSY